MIKNFSFFILGALLYALNIGLLKNFLFFSALPNLLLIICIYVTLEEEGEFYLFFCFFCGLILDFTSGIFLGSFALSFLLLSRLLRFISKDVAALQKNWKYLPAVLFFFQVGVVVWIFLYNLAAEKLFSAPVIIFYPMLLKTFFWQYVYNLVFLFPVWKLALLPAKMEAKFSPRGK